MTGVPDSESPTNCEAVAAFFVGLTSLATRAPAGFPEALERSDRIARWLRDHPAGAPSDGDPGLEGHANRTRHSWCRSIAPFLLLSLPAGVWVDRLPRQPMLVAADLGRAFILGPYPLQAWSVRCASNCSTLWLLYLVGVCAGALTAIFDVACQSFLPQVVPRDHLVDETRISRSVALCRRSLAPVRQDSLFSG